MLLIFLILFWVSFGLQAETLEDLYEWKAALENALSQAPSAAVVMGQNGVLKNDQAEAADGSAEQCMLLLIKVVFHMYCLLATVICDYAIVPFCNCQHSFIISICY